MMKNGSFAVAVVQRQVVVVQATKSHSKREKYLEVTPYTPFGGSRIFLSLSGQPYTVRIPSSDVLALLPSSQSSPAASCAGYIDSDTESDYDSDAHFNFNGARDVKAVSANVVVGDGTIELPEQAFEEYVRLSEKHYNRPRSASRSAKLWTSIVGRAGSVRH
ncbi:hypothetical protein D9611_014663 [Ephemerocybe angulata]|uniref:Uncharacterized protein n=2 Tax=Ephemerocybe angulata TaxID=980116 RepID=A0A8H6M5L1_9AGAR|nr:hypothetical protein D9611_014663 [Tulosesus angulatus]KAF6753036.1 hypothetical protein DFP72DRAFT_903181 [Tulosesus angulatus]